MQDFVWVHRKNVVSMVGLWLDQRNTPVLGTLTRDVAGKTFSMTTGGLYQSSSNESHVSYNCCLQKSMASQLEAMRKAFLKPLARWTE